MIQLNFEYVEKQNYFVKFSMGDYRGEIFFM